MKSIRRSSGIVSIVVELFFFLFFTLTACSFIRSWSWRVLYFRYLLPKLHLFFCFKVSQTIAHIHRIIYRFVCLFYCVCVCVCMSVSIAILLLFIICLRVISPALGFLTCIYIMTCQLTHLILKIIAKVCILFLNEWKHIQLSKVELKTYCVFQLEVGVSVKVNRLKHFTDYMSIKYIFLVPIHHLLTHIMYLWSNKYTNHYKR